MKKIFKIVPFIIVAVLVGVTAVYAGNLNPPSGPIANTMHSLSDIYNLAIGEGPSEINPTLTTNPELVGGGYTLNEVYDAVSTALASSGGTDLSNMWNGSSSTISGGSQANGGIDDANYNSNGVPQAPPSDRFETTWTPCTSGVDNYCGTGDEGANAKDEATGLVWSYLCHGIACSSWDNPGTSIDNDTYYSWDSLNANNDTGLPEGDTVKLTAQQLCSQHTGWSLPHQKQLMQAYIDGAYGNGKLDTVGVHRVYWSATTYSIDAGDAWGVYLYNGYTNNGYKGGGNTIRCVRE